MSRHLNAAPPAALLALATMLVAPMASAEAPGRYTMSPAVGGGFVRLDTQTGQMSLCNRVNTQWTCEAMADQGRGLSEEVARLREDNKRLRQEVRRLDDLVLGIAPGKGANGRKLELPTEQDVDRVMTYLQRMIKKFQDKLKEFEPDKSARPKSPPATPL